MKKRKAAIVSHPTSNAPYAIASFKDRDDDFMEEKSLKEFVQYCKKSKIDFDIYIIPPIGKFKKFKDNIVIFPLSYEYYDKSGNVKIWFMLDTVLYKGELYEHANFFKDFRENELINTGKMLACLNPEVLVKVPFSLVSLPTKEFVQVKQRYLTPARSLLCKIGVVKEARGIHPKLSDVGEERRQFVIQEFRKKDCSKWEIWNRWCKYVDEEYPSAENADELHFTYKTIWRDCQGLKK